MVRICLAVLVWLSAVSVAHAEAFTKNAWELDGPVVKPWKVIEPDPAYHGQWLVAGDLDGDGTAEIITARQQKQVVTAMVATKLDGTVLWKWGKPDGGNQRLGFDVPVQIYDLDGDGKQEVFVSERGSLIVLEGATGKEIRRHALPSGLKVADCIAFANLRGGPRARDIIIKDRYKKMWAYTDDWKPLWQWQPPKGFRTCHYPQLIDIDANGRDDVMAGYTFLNPDGTERHTLSAKTIDLIGGHQDDCAVLVDGKGKPEDYRLVQSCCGAKGLVMLDGRGKVFWEIAGRHFESIDIGKVRADVPGDQIVVDIAHEPYRKGTIEVIDARGKVLGVYYCGDSRMHRLIDWDGDGIMEIVAGQEQRLLDGKGNCVARLGGPEVFADAADLSGATDGEPFALIGDLDGDERPEIIVYSTKRIAIYRNEKAAKVPSLKLGTGTNVTLY